MFDILHAVTLGADEYVPSTCARFAELQRRLPAYVVGDREFLERLKTALAAPGG